MNPYSTEKENIEVERYCVKKESEQAMSMKYQQIPAEVESVWEYINNGLLEAADEIRGWK